MKNKKIMVIGALVLSLAFILSACGSKTTQTPAAQTNPPVAAVPSASVIAEGRVVPRKNTALFFMSGGKVGEVLVNEGDVVSKGDVLARLGDRDPSLANVAAAKTDVAAAQQAFDNLNRTASLAYNQAVLDEVVAQKAYYAALKAWDDFDKNKYEDDLDQAKADTADMKKKLDDAKDEFNKYASLDRNNSNRKQAQTDLDNAQSNYDEALSRQSEIENKYNQLKSDLDLAKAKMDEAQRTRENRTDGPDKDQLTLAQARLDAATASLQSAQSALNNLDLVAPYDGIVAKVDIAAGEEVTPGQPVITFADQSQWYVDTTDLTEKEVVNLAENMDVIVIPDALPELQLKGTIESISDYYTEKSGDIVYKVRVKLLDTDPRLRWGMTTETRFLEPSK